MANKKYNVKDYYCKHTTRCTVEGKKRSKRFVGQNVLKADAEDKVTGEAVYANDITFEDTLYIKVKRAVHPHAVLKDIDISKAKKVKGVVDIITAEDIPEVRKFGLIIRDQPVLIGIGEKMRYMGDALAVVVAENKEAALKARDLIEVKVDKLEIINDPFRAMEADAPDIHPDGNILITHNLDRGDVEAGFAESDIIVENKYQTQFIDQLPMQNEAGTAFYDEKKGVVNIWAATQWLHDTQADVAQSLRLAKDQVRIIQPTIGGAFGKKEDVSVHIHLAIAAIRTGRPVKFTYTREESMITQSKRHPITIYNKTGVTKDGYLKAWETKFIGDTGAYASSGPAVVHKGMYHATGPYNVPNIKGVSHAVYTNNTYCGAMRGFGTTQGAFGYESQMDILAEKLEMDPAEFRMKNIYHIGSCTPNGQQLNHSVNAEETIKRVMELSGWKGGKEK
jgi:CO/xanthine dehydrogenase Mo-binding subunit